MSVELAIGDSTLHVASEFADAGILSPLTIGDGTHCSAYCSAAPTGRA
jgi:hypothetical protein